MTSQLILANGHGIALASDSAVSFGETRTYDTSEKIYPLPLPHRAAVLHAGSVMCHGLPYTTLINEWILSLGDVQLRTIFHYQENFKAWLHDNIATWANERQLSIDFLNSLYGDLRRIRNIAQRNGSGNSDEELQRVFECELDDLIVFTPETSSFHQTWARKIFDYLQPSGVLGNGWSIQEVVEYVFTDLEVSESLLEKIYEYVLGTLERRYPNIERNTCILTFVGYGASEIVPTSSTMKIHGFLDDCIFWDPEPARVASREGTGMFLLQTIGQDDAIDLVLRGYSRDLLEATKSKVSGLIDVSSSELESEDGSSPSMANSVGDAIEGAVFDLSESNNLLPLRRTIAGLPLMTMASTARSLIEVQELSLNIRGRMPSVGGPVKVGVITKSHGFKWIDSRNEYQVI